MAADMRRHLRAAGRHQLGVVVSALLVAALSLSCASTVEWTVAWGKGGRAVLLQDRDKVCITPETKTTTETDNKLVGPADTKVTTEPAPLPNKAESQAGEIPKAAWWAGFVCLFTVRC